MKKLILSAVVAVTAIFMGAQPAEAGCCKKRCGISLPKLCIKKKVCTQEVCRRYHCKTKCVCGCPKTVRYVTITYRTTYRDCCGRCSYKCYTRTYKC